MLGNYPDYAGAAGNVDEKRCRESSQKLVDALVNKNAASGTGGTEFKRR